MQNIKSNVLSSDIYNCVTIVEDYSLNHVYIWKSESINSTASILDYTYAR